MKVFGPWPARLLPAIDAVLQAALMVALFAGYFRAGALAIAAGCILAAPMCLRLLRTFGAYDSQRMEKAGGLARKILSAHLACLAIFLVPALLAPQPGVAVRTAAFFLASAATLTVERLLLHRLLRSIRRHGYDRRKVCVIGSLAAANVFAHRFAEVPEWGLEIVCVGEGAPQSRTFRAFPSGEPLPGQFEELHKQRAIDEVLIVAPAEALPAESQAAQLYERYGLLVRVVLEPGSATHTRVVEEFFGTTAVTSGSPLHSESAMAVKRLFDLVVASVLLVHVAPLMALIAVLVKLSSPGPIFFTQIRSGMNGRRFRIIKFRTMVDGAESLIRHSHTSITRGPVFKDPSDYRITLVGRYLRRLSLDELPQLFNVLKGDMSMVGPRPLPVHEADRITGENRRRFSVPPGITCLWQVNGRSDVSYETWMTYDLQYVDKWSIWADTRLLFRTVPAVLSRRGAY